MNIARMLQILKSEFEVPAAVGQIDAGKYEEAKLFRRMLMLENADVPEEKLEDFMEKLNAALGLTQAAATAPAANPGAKDRFDKAAGHSQIDLEPGAVFVRATRWVGPNIAGLPKLIADAALKGAPRVKKSGLQTALGMYPHAYEQGGEVMFDKHNELHILEPTLRNQLVVGILNLWKNVGMDSILIEAAKYQRHAEVSKAIKDAQASSSDFLSPQEIWDLCLSAIKQISDTVTGQFNEGLASLLGQEFDLLLLPALEDSGFVTYGLGIPVLSGNALQTILDSPEHAAIRAAKLLSDTMVEAITVLFEPEKDSVAYTLKLGKVAIKYSTAVKRFAALSPTGSSFREEQVVTLTTVQSTMTAWSEKNTVQQTAMNNGNIVAGYRGVAAQNITGSVISTGDNTSVFNQAGQTVYGHQLNTGGGANIGGNVDTGGGDFHGRDVAYNFDDSDETPEQRAARIAEKARRKAEKALRKVGRGW